MQRRSVDFPDPEGPMMQTTSPLRTSKEMPLNTSIEPNDLWTSRMEIIGWSGVQPCAEAVKIGRASCRERLYTTAGARAGKRQQFRRPRRGHGWNDRHREP